MTKARAIRSLILASVAVLMFMAMGERAVSAQCPPPLGAGNGGRGGTRGGGQDVQVVVKLNGTPQAGVTVTVTGSAKSTPIAKVTDSNGVATISALKVGHYTVAATADAGMASKSIAVVESTDPLIVSLVLVPKTP
jgi:hypothetical protein